MSDGRPRAEPDGSGEAPRRRPFDANDIQAVMPERPQGSWLLRAFLIGLLACGGYGGYFGYCRYKLNDKQWAFTQAYQKLHMALLADSNVTPVDEDAVANMVRRFAKESDVAIVKDTLKITVEPLGIHNENKLPTTAQSAVAMVGMIPKANQERYLVGFSGTFYVKRGPASMTFDAERYTWLLDTVMAQAQEAKKESPGLQYEPLRDEELD